MSIQEFFYLSAGIGVWIITILLIAIAYKIKQTLNSIENALRSYAEVKNDLNVAGDAVKLGAYTLVSKFLSSLTKRG